MTTIRKRAREAAVAECVRKHPDKPHSAPCLNCFPWVNALLTFAKAEREEERERCAKVAEQAGACDCRTGDSRDPRGAGQEHWGDCPQFIVSALRRQGGE